MRPGKRFPVILNPAAHGEKAGSLEARISGLSDDLELHITTSPEDAREFAFRLAAEGRPAIGVAGGDGTINDVLTGIGDADVALGILPVGTMNVLALELGLPAHDLAGCWEIIRRGHAREVDVWKANGVPFIQLAGVGLDAQVTYEVTREMKRRWGPLSYVVSMFRILKRRPPRLTVTTGDGETFKGRIVLVGNGKHYAGPFKVFRDATNNDGLLDIVIFQNQTYLSVLRYLRGVAFGGLSRMGDVVRARSAEFQVTSRRRPAPLELDGDPAGQTPVQFRHSGRMQRVFVGK